jgi:hypothetical protein
VKVKERWEGDAYHPEMEKNELGGEEEVAMAKIGNGGELGAALRQTG